MRLNPSEANTTHLTYCGNVHPGETLEEVRAALATHTLAVKQRVSPSAPFGVGLRLSARAARELSHPEQLASFQSLLAEHDLYVFTLNAFPFGDFHAASVKERVYMPDWRSAERRVYTDACAELLASLLPADTEGSISTVPLGFRPEFVDERAVLACVEQLLLHAATLVRLERERGRRITLALEPEPFCALETLAETTAFFEAHLFARETLLRFAAQTGEPLARAEQLLRAHVGVCLDACHLAVTFEAPETGVERLRRAGVKVAKIQVSAGLEASFESFSEPLASELERFADPVYLHQVFECAVGESAPRARYLDLGEALARARAVPELARCLRIHFHVPVFARELGRLRSTQRELSQLLAIQRRSPIARHLEVETYTWDVLPEVYRNEPIADAIARELRYTLDELARD